MGDGAPLYIVSKGRYDTRLTARALESMGVPYSIVVEQQEVEKYAAVIDRSKILVLDPAYQREYDTCDALGDTKSKGPGPARNFVWDHAVSIGASWHWVMDDNIRSFVRLNKNKKVKCVGDAFFRAQEAFARRFKNVAMAGPNYWMFVPRKAAVPPFVVNTRIYSCNLIRNSVPFRWRGRYNEDTDLSLRMLKSGWATVQFNAFLQDKMKTQTVHGGNTAAFYAKEGTFAKSAMQVNLHPDCSRLSMRFGRVHHYVDYSRFKSVPLLQDESERQIALDGEFGMDLVSIPGAKSRYLKAANP